jgi:predicted metal-dependent phosphoesterase TrpH
MKRLEGNGADLHLHSNYSDGELAPAEVMRACATAGLQVVSLTDHDTVKGMGEAESAARSLGLELVPGCEISVEFEGQDLHLLGYFIDVDAEGLGAYLRLMESRRLRRVEQIVERLRSLGVQLTVERVLAGARDASSVGRPHVARALIQGGWVGSYQEAFSRYLGDRGPAFVAKETTSLDDAVRMIREASGCVVLAHPGIYDLDTVLPELERLGIAGIEVLHPAHTDEQVRTFSELADRKGWVSTGGSDYHGGLSCESPVGSPRVGCHVVEELRRRTERG